MICNRSDQKWKIICIINQKCHCFGTSELMEELIPLIREAIDRKQENMRRRRRRDALRVVLVRLLELIAKNERFAYRFVTD